MTFHYGQRRGQWTFNQTVSHNPEEAGSGMEKKCPVLELIFKTGVMYRVLVTAEEKVDEP